MGFDVERARNETRGCRDVVHLNNAGAALMPIPVADRLHAYLTREEQIGGYEAADEEEGALENFYVAGARLLGCAADEIAFVENATRAWDMAFYGFRFAPGDRILTTLAEYGSNVIAYLQQVRRYGVEVIFVPNDAHGQIDTGALEGLVDGRVKLISITHVPTGGGLVNPAREIGRIARGAGVPFLLDACQSLGQLPLDVDEIGCDVLTGTGRKFLRGPRGTGLLYVRRALLERLEPPLLDQHAATLLSPSEYEVRSDARRFENWEQNCAGKVGLGVAMDYALSWGLESIRDRVYALADALRARLGEIEGVRVTDEGLERCGIVTFETPGTTASEVQRRLRERRVNVSTSEGSGSLVSFRARGLSAVVRASVHYYNTEEELDRFAAALRSILAPRPRRRD